MPLDTFHPLVREWFSDRFGEPTAPQRQGWPQIAAGRNTLIAAPTGSGKTLAAFLVCLNRLWQDWLEGRLNDGVRVVYVSPLKALSNDIERNLQQPLAELRELASHQGFDPPPIRTAVRTGDTPQSARQKMLRAPPHILVTTPESLYLMLTSDKSRDVLRTVDTAIVDEIHALARDKRGSHLSLTLERLAELCEKPPVRIGLSATQRPIDEIAKFLVGSHVAEVRLVGTGRGRKSFSPHAADEPQHVPTTKTTPDPISPGDQRNTVFIVDGGHSRDLDLAVEVPPSELSAVCSNEQWGEVYEQLVALIQSHRSTLVFVNTRRLAERVSHHLRQVLGEDAVAGHHGSLAKELRHSAEQRLKNGELKAIVATASLEMGIDVGYIDLVCQVGSPRAIATFLQRVGRSGHSLGLTPKGRLFPLTRDELLECMALVRAIRRGELDRIEIPESPLDILAQQIVATVACDEWEEDRLFELCRRAWPYRQLSRKRFDEVVEMLSSGLTAGTKRGLYLHRDRINGRVRARRGARLAAITSGGAIPDAADYRVVTEPEKTFVGTLDEDFAIESMAGDVFLLGNTSWRVQQVRSGEVIVRDAEGAPPSVPFWFGEGPGRTIELSAEVSKLRQDIASSLSNTPNSTHSAADPSFARLQVECGADKWSIEQATNYVESQVAAIGLVPTKEQVVFERFFDESGGMQLVIHSPFGARINRAWGLALRKRFCRSFDFELQAAATDNGIVLSLSPQHSFPIDSLFKMIGPHNARYLLEQAVLAAPMFQVRWRWNVTRSLAVLRRQNGKKVPPHLLRFRSDDLLAAAFPETVGCLENHHGDVEIPDHPLVGQTMHDCLTEAMDVERWVGVLQDVQDSKIQLVPCDTREPSPFSHELLNANPYAFLDGAALEERRTRAVSTRRSFSAEEVRDLAQLDPAAIAQVRADAWPIVRDADELHEALLTLVVIPEKVGTAWQSYLDELLSRGRATSIRCGQHVFWIAAESWPVVRAVYDDLIATPEVNLPAALDTACERAAGWIELVRGQMQVRGPVVASELANELALDESHVASALEVLEGEGVVLRGRFTSGTRPTNSSGSEIEWCDRRLLTRIHRLTLDGLRQKIKPVAPEDFIRFLLRRHRLSDESKWGGAVGVREAIAQLQGFEIPAGAWESKVLAARCRDYDPQWLDHLFMAGEVAWGRLQTPKRDETKGKIAAAMTRSMPISLVLREDLPWLLTGERGDASANVSSYGEAVLAALSKRGALFFQELKAATNLLPGHLEDALRELSTLGLVTCDMFAAVRTIVGKQPARRGGRRRLASPPVAAPAGRWSCFPGLIQEVASEDQLTRWCRLLLRRYGIVFRDLLTRESVAPPWHELVRVFRRLELQGEVRGGRFIMGVAGEQFAEEAAIGELRAVREAGPDASWVVLSAVDPLNLAGVILAGTRVVANSKNALILQGGNCVAAKQSDRVEFFEKEFFCTMSPEVESAMRRALQVGKREPNSHVRPSWLESDRKSKKAPDLTSRVPSRSLRQT